jgi:hypothetical protein
MLVASLFRDSACLLVQEGLVNPIPLSDVNKALIEGHRVDEATWPEQSRLWHSDSDLMPGMWTMPNEYGLLPRMRLLEGWNPDVNHVAPPFHPTCLSTRSNDPRFNLTPTANYDWEDWTHQDYPDKPYLVARRPGAQVSFELETNVGWIKMYSLRSRDFGLGSVKCWADEALDRAVRVDGWWDNEA